MSATVKKITCGILNDMALHTVGQSNKKKLTENSYNGFCKQVECSGNPYMYVAYASFDRKVCLLPKVWLLKLLVWLPDTRTDWGVDRWTPDEVTSVCWSATVIVENREFRI